MSRNKAIVILAGLIVGGLLGERRLAGLWMPAQTGPEQTTIAGAAGVDSDVPRAVEYYSYNRVAKSGPARGEEFYYFKCWPCHNEFQKVAPQLKDLYQRGKLLSGQPVTDEAVKDKIRNGGAIMPAFRYELNDADLADLVRSALEPGLKERISEFRKS